LFDLYNFSFRDMWSTDSFSYWLNLYISFEFGLLLKIIYILTRQNIIILC